MLGNENIDNFNPFIDNYLGITSDINDCAVSDNSNSSPIRLNSHDINASVKPFDGIQ